jgi:hypothetical protein
MNMSEMGTDLIQVGIVVANTTRAQWIELLLSPLPGLQVHLWTGQPGQPGHFDVLIIDADQPGSTFLGWYQRTVSSSSLPHLLVLGAPDSPLMMHLEWEVERTRFIPKPYQLESLREILLTQSRNWNSLRTATPTAPVLRQPLGYLSSLPIADLIQMLCLSRWSGRVIATELGTNRVGHVYLNGGVLVHAETPEAQSAEACLQLIHWGKCDFYFEEQHPPVVATITKPWQELLLEGARLLDESQQHSGTG